eukprot:CAMPEP_0183752040 /NCGR_PEP_ID=MMETSP0739-20130205/2115_1 /TAXON_ID=385413 /ORGANISM="Thalassiosira miniscula, Strain CCMP1093" /LENGTH=134 /DNA_ID=CAMNT_0025988351 /DNA_START=83 /DNA_END=487 /DNA_ORIENTATION=+
MNKPGQTAQTIRAPIATATATEPAAELDLRGLNETDLDLLQQTDPFMYNSIPLIYTSKLFLNDISNASVAQSVERGVNLSDSMVTRKSRISTESHMSVLMEDILNMNSNDFNLDDEEYDFDSFCQLGGKIHSLD